MAKEDGKTENQVQENEFFEKQFLIGLAEIDLGQNTMEGNLETITDNDIYPDRINSGRLSFYLKGKIKGKYLLTFWLDTGKESLEELLTDIIKPETKTAVEKINPEKYYPVYGDNSTLSSDINTEGKLYIPSFFLISSS